MPWLNPFAVRLKRPVRVLTGLKHFGVLVLTLLFMWVQRAREARAA